MTTAHYAHNVGEKIVRYLSVYLPAPELTATVRLAGRVNVRNRGRVEVRVMVRVTVTVSTSISVNNNNSGAGELTDKYQ